MSKLIIWVSGKPTLNGYKRRDFVWSLAHNAFIYEGRELDESEFNEKCEKAFRNNEDLHPRVKLVKFSAGTVTQVEPQPEKTTATVSTAPIATITASREITLAEAEAVMKRLAPQRLKKPMGRPPKVRTMEVA